MGKYVRNGRFQLCECLRHAPLTPAQLRVVAKTILQGSKRLLHFNFKITKLKCKCVELCFEFVLMSEDANVENNFLAFLGLVECSHQGEDDVKVEVLKDE